MEGITTVKVSDLEQLFNLNTQLLSEIKQLKQIEEDIRAYSIQKTADMIGLHYTTIRSFVKKGILFAKYVDGTRGKCIIPYWSIKEYLKSTKNSNQ
ncbi:MAG: hypothetical protein H0U95_18415 [Bacteroidetes bacterium]|nr:hypothetical protein [Bacteroidota bacterium]